MGGWAGGAPAILAGVQSEGRETKDFQGGFQADRRRNTPGLRKIRLPSPPANSAGRNSTPRNPKTICALAQH